MTSGSSPVESAEGDSPAKEGLPSFFARRWRGEVPMRTVLLRDMLLVGSAVNLLATFAALLFASQGAPLWAAAGLHFAPLPYNIFLFAAVGRALPPSPAAAMLALGWLVVMTAV